MRIKTSLLTTRVDPVLAQDVGETVDRWRRDQGLTQAQLQRTARISQSQLSRILDGRFTRVSAAVQRLCSAAGVDLHLRLTAAPSDSRWRTELEQELLRSWDGTPGHARELIRLLRIAKALRVAA